jgi:hypothetical protein
MPGGWVANDHGRRLGVVAGPSVDLLPDAGDENRQDPGTTAIACNRFRKPVKPIQRAEPVSRLIR